MVFTLTPTLPHPRGREAMTDAFRFTPGPLAVRTDSTNAQLRWSLPSFERWHSRRNIPWGIVAGASAWGKGEGLHYIDFALSLP